MGYGVIGSPTGSGPVSLGSSPGTPATSLTSAVAHGSSRVYPLSSYPGLAAPVAGLSAGPRGTGEGSGPRAVPDRGAHEERRGSGPRGQSRRVDRRLAGPAGCASLSARPGLQDLPDSCTPAGPAAVGLPGRRRPRPPCGPWQEAPSSSGPGRRPLKAVAPVQIRSGLLVE